MTRKAISLNSYLGFKEIRLSIRSPKVIVSIFLFIEEDLFLR